MQINITTDRKKKQKSNINFVLIYDKGSIEFKSWENEQMLRYVIVHKSPFQGER